MRKTQIFVLGGVHVKKLPVEKILKLEPKPEVIISEGVDSRDTFKIKNLIRAPIFSGFMSLYGRAMKFFPAESKSLNEIEKRLAVKKIVAEEGMTEVINFLFPFNWVAFAILFCVYFFFIPKSLPNVIMMLIFLPVLFDVVYTLSPRNRVMVEKATEIIKTNKFNSVFFYCGAYHKKEIAQLLREKDFQVNEV